MTYMYSVNSPSLTSIYKATHDLSWTFEPWILTL